MKDIYYIVAHRDQKEIDSFKTRYEDFNTSLIPDIFKSSLNLKVKNFKPSTSWGTSHVIYIVYFEGQHRPLIFRANLGFNNEPEYVMQIEKLVTDEVNKLGVPVNKVLYVDVSRTKYPFDFQIQEVLDGVDLENHFKGTKEDYDKMSFDLGQMIAKYTQISFSKFGLFSGQDAINNNIIGTKDNFYDYIITYLDKDLEFLVKAKVITNDKSKKIFDLFKDYENIINIKKGSLIHHDLADHNIMFINNNITGIFDWEACVVGDPVLDLASCPTWRTHYPREEKLVEGYKSIKKLPDFFQEKMNIYRLRTMLWKIVFAIRAGILNEKRRQTFLNSLIPFKLT